MSYKFFENTTCEYFPCHKYPNKVFSCIFCYCPLYPYKNCGGDYTILPNNLKDCSSCIVPHKPENYDYIINKVIDNNIKYIKGVK